MISFSLSGSTDNTRKFLERMKAPDLFSGLERLAQLGVSALQANTPKESGLTAASWDYEIEVKNGKTTIWWINKHIEDGVNIAVILQYGHGTGTGGYIAGRDYINPSIKPIFDEISNQVWKKVTSA